MPWPLEKRRVSWSRRVCWRILRAYLKWGGSSKLHTWKENFERPDSPCFLQLLAASSCFFHLGGWYIQKNEMKVTMLVVLSKQDFSSFVLEALFKSRTQRLRQPSVAHMPFLLRRKLNFLLQRGARNPLLVQLARGEKNNFWKGLHKLRISHQVSLSYDLTWSEEDLASFILEKKILSDRTLHVSFSCLHVNFIKGFLNLSQLVLKLIWQYDSHLKKQHCAYL